MIWDPNNDKSSASGLAGHIVSQIESVCGVDLMVDPANVDNIARAVEMFLEQKNGDGAVESKYLVLLASKALHSVGEEQAARRMLLFGTGLVKPSEWEFSAGSEMWVLDLKQMTIKTDAFIELVFFNSLNVVLESTADIWDNSQGHGVLGLQHVCSVATALFGAAAKKKEEAIADEIKSLCVRKLDSLRQQRGWRETPRITNLDL
jgi:hypothetical protein